MVRRATVYRLVAQVMYGFLMVHIDDRSHKNSFSVIFTSLHCKKQSVYGVRGVSKTGVHGVLGLRCVFTLSELCHNT